MTSFRITFAAIVVAFAWQTCVALRAQGPAFLLDAPRAPVHARVTDDADSNQGELPRPAYDQVGGDFPPLPPDPNESDKDPLPPLEEELWLHGGAHLYEPEGDQRNWPDADADAHYEVLRLPENWQRPEPLTAFQDFLGADTPIDRPRLHWPGLGGYAWEPQFVGYGSYQLFGFALEQDKRRQDVVGHQLLVDLDLRLTGTERFHMQFRPLGRRNAGGSFYQFSEPEGYVNNMTAEPDRYWFEGELHSMLGAYVDPFSALDYQIVVGKFPLELHNFMLISDDILGVAINKNTIYAGELSNLNIQTFWAFNDVDRFVASDSRLYGVHVSADHRRTFYEATYAFVEHDTNSSRDAHYTALSRTSHYGPMTVALRALLKFGDRGGIGDGQLYVAESNWVRVFDDQPLGIEHAVFYCNAFLATDGWSPISGGNLNRLRASFEVNPLIQIAAGRPRETWGVAVGAQLFRCHEDESFLPEIAFESPDDEAVWGFGLRYLRKTGPRTYFEALGSFNFSDDPRFEREGVFVSETIVF